MSSPNQAPTKVVLELAKDHLDLAALEWEQAKSSGWRRLLVRGGGAILLFSAYVFFHVALVSALRSEGMGLVSIGILMGVLYSVLGGLALFMAHRQAMAEDPPFKGTRDELTRSAAWIEKLFF